MYTETDYQNTKRHVTRHLIVMLVILALTIGGCAVCLMARIRLLNLAVAIVGCMCVAVYCSLYFLPWFRYQRYLSDIRSGRSHESDVTFLSFSDQTTLRDGVAMHDMVVSLVKDSDAQEDQRLFFWDDDKARPQLKPGDSIHIRYFGNYIIALDVQ